MTKNISHTAIVLAAGLGARMRPLTLTKPKPLQMVGGRTMLDHALDKLVAVGIKRAVVNTFYLAEQIEAHVQSRHDIDIIISRETELLDTGGGIANVIHEFDGKPFFALNADLPSIDSALPSLTRMQNFWDGDKMDSLLLLMPTNKVCGIDRGRGDFALEEDGRIWRKDLPPPRPYVCIGAQIVKSEFYLDPPGKIFSNNYIWDIVEGRNRLYGIVHDGECYHIGTVEDWRIANALLESGQGWGM